MQYDIFLYSGRTLQEDDSENRTGTEHVVVPLEILAFPHPNFSVFTVADARRALGSRVLG